MTVFGIKFVKKHIKRHFLYLQQLVLKSVKKDNKNYIFFWCKYTLVKNMR